VGNGSPRLLTQLLRRAALVLLGSLLFAPNALADDGLITVALNADPVSVAVTVPQPAAPAVADAPTAPSVPVTPVATALPARLRAAEAPVDATPPATHVAAEPPRHVTVKKSFSPTRKPTVRGTASPRPAGSSRIGVPVRGAFPMARAVSPARGPAPRPHDPPAPAPFGFGQASSDNSVPAPSLFLLVALAAAFAVVRAGPLGRHMPLLLAAPRPHPYLLRLERPD
jgi:hypothetical protein